MLLHTVLPILLCVIVTMVLGFLWYSQWLFGKAWAQEVRVDKTRASAQSMMTAMIVHVLCTIVTSYVILISMRYISVDPWRITERVVILWAAFGLCTHLTHWMYEQKSLRFMLISGGFDLISVLLSTVILLNLR